MIKDLNLESKVSYIVDLDYKNYMIYLDEILGNVSEIARIASLDVAALSKLSNVCAQTLRKMLVAGDMSVRFKTVNKLNNFVGDVLLKGSMNDGDA